MGLKLIFLIFLLCCLPLRHSYGQLIADFTFSDTSNMPASLLKNTAGPDALNIHTEALSNGQGVYTRMHPAYPNTTNNLDLEVPVSIFKDKKSIYMEWDFRSQEDFAWLINFGFNLSRFAHANSPDQQGFHLRYATKADTSRLISSGFVGEPLDEGERALIAFMYDKASGTAYIFKNGSEVWQTPAADKTPGFGLHWETEDGRLRIGAAMDGKGSPTPSLYHFRVYEEGCAAAPPPVTRADTVCHRGPATLYASGGEEGQYRWYKGDGETFSLIPDEHSNTFITDTLSQSETFYVSIASEGCESPLVPVQAVVLPQPPQPVVHFTPPCGPDTVTIHIEEKEDSDEHRKKNSYSWYTGDGTLSTHEGSSLTLHLNKDTTLYVSTLSLGCESDLETVSISLNELPTVDAGPDKHILKGKSIDLMASGDFIRCSWTPQENLEFPDSPYPKVSPEITQTYVVTGVGANGCENSDTVRVFVTERFPVPNAFSPNNDGRNDTWEIPTIEEHPNCRLLIFNKWGERVFYSEGYPEAWDGTYQGKPVSSGTYYYSLRLNEEEKLIKGSVLLLR